MNCPPKFSPTVTPNGQTDCVDAIGYTVENYEINHSIAIDRCRDDLPTFVGLAAAAVLLPGWWKAPAVAVLAVAWSLSEFGGPGCPALISNRYKV